MVGEVAAWQEHRGTSAMPVNWRFLTEVARIKLKSLYPSIQWFKDNSSAAGAGYAADTFPPGKKTIVSPRKTSTNSFIPYWLCKRRTFVRRQSFA